MTTLWYKNVNKECGLYTTNIVIMGVMLWKYEKQTCEINKLKIVSKQFTINI